MRTPADQAGRARLLDELDTTFVVEAAAGTGKTTVLVDRIVRVVTAGRARLEQLIAVTFTEKAAGEMKLRLRDKLEAAREASEGVERARLTQALEELEVARIGTIHGLCADLLREYPVEAGVDPLFEVAAGPEQEALLHEVFSRRFQVMLEAPPEGVRRMLRRRLSGHDGESPRLALREALASLVEHRDFSAPWRREPFERDAAIDALLPRLEAFGARERQLRLKGERSGMLDSVRAAGRLAADVKHRESVSARDYDGLEAQLRELGADRFLWTSKPWGLAFSGGLSEAQLVAERDGLAAALFDFRARSDADLAALLHAELSPLVTDYEAEKARRGVLDFVDLLLKTRDLLVRDAPVRAALQRRFTRIFVDEFQDTDPLQSELVLLLAADDPGCAAPFSARPAPGKLFVVGDPKQSIYRFRRADLSLYQRVKAHLVAHGAEVVYLSTSFRSTPGIQAAVNGAFGPAMVGAHQATWVPLDPWREARKDQPSVVALPAPRPLGPTGKATRGAVEASLPEAVAGFIEWLVTRSGWTVEEDGARVPVRPRHVCILFKRLRRWRGVDVPRPWAQALEARRVPHVLVGGRSFHAREEVAALRTALLAIDRPDDEFSVYATLRGPLFAFTDEALLAFKHAAGALHPLRPFEGTSLPEGASEVVEALELLRALHLARNRRPVASTVSELLERTRAHAGLAFWAGGAQVLANVLQVAEVSRGHEQRATSFRDVVEALERDAEEGVAPEAPLVEEGTEGVRLMTVHAAKGLEFPVVILAEPTAPLARPAPSHWVDPETGLWVHPLAGCVPIELREREEEVLERDAEEALRLAYVAATRAKELLVVPTCSEKRFEDTWLKVLEPALWPMPGTEHRPRPAPGCPDLGRDTIVDRVGPVPPDRPIPGLHISHTRMNGVVWWGAAALGHGLEEAHEFEWADALEDEPTAASETRARWHSWREARARAQRLGAEPTTRVVAARELPPMSLPADVTVEDTGVARATRPSGRRFGELVHACLALVPLAAGEAEVQGVVDVVGRSLGATEAEASAASAAVLAALSHPRLEAARRASEVRREATIIEHLADGTVVEGAVDLAYLGPDGWVVVEFKTDVELDGSLGAYAAQTSAYVRAIAAATGRPARGVILRV
jgi:ATP-dependent exoDNAse (exonuclease V) beta subunit